jgi:hypothetical protein
MRCPWKKITEALEYFFHFRFNSCSLNCNCFIWINYFKLENKIQLYPPLVSHLSNLVPVFFFKWPINFIYFLLFILIHFVFKFGHHSFYCFFFLQFYHSKLNWIKIKLIPLESEPDSVGSSIQTHGNRSWQRIQEHWVQRQDPMFLSLGFLNIIICLINIIIIIKNSFFFCIIHIIIFIIINIINKRINKCGKKLLLLSLSLINLKNTIITIEKKPSFFSKIKKYNSKYSYKKYNYLCYKYNYFSYNSKYSY